MYYMLYTSVVKSFGHSSSQGKGSHKGPAAAHHFFGGFGLVKGKALLKGPSMEVYEEKGLCLVTT